MYIDKKLLNLWQECNPSYFILVSCEKKEQYVQNKETELCPLVVQYKPQKKKSLKNYSKSKEKKNTKICVVTFWKKVTILDDLTCQGHERE